jgi:hypothetical protein
MGAATWIAAPALNFKLFHLEKEKRNLDDEKRRLTTEL